LGRIILLCTMFDLQGLPLHGAGAFRAKLDHTYLSNSLHAWWCFVAGRLLASSGLNYLLCWLFHRNERETLLPGSLPGGLDAVVFCWRCDRMRGRAVRVFQPNLARF
jgi:hypothetical protein